MKDDTILHMKNLTKFLFMFLVSAIIFFFLWMFTTGFLIRCPCLWNRIGKEVCAILAFLIVLLISFFLYVLEKRNKKLFVHYILLLFAGIVTYLILSTIAFQILKDCIPIPLLH